jgi:tetratricopeptide (TPR) repeat protein
VTQPTGPSSAITGALRRVRQRPSTLEVDTVAAAVQARLFGRESDAPALGRYRLRRRLGSGGLGVVFEAHDAELDRSVAVKLMRRHAGLSAADLERFEREAGAMARVSHPHVVEVFDVGRYDRGDALGASAGDPEVPDAGVFIVMERLDGRDLHQWAQEPRSLHDVLGVFVQAGRGLAAAHQAGIVHRDFKPHNVMVTTHGAKVLDFGLASLQGSPSTTASGGRSGDAISGPPLSSLTRTGFVMGTPAYMAPEQHAGETVGAPADQYALCVALVEALLGRRPFQGETLGELEAHKRQAAVPRDPRVPRRLHRVLRRGLAVRAEDRYPSMDALVAELETIRARTQRRWAPAAVLAFGGMVLGAVAWLQPFAARSVVPTTGAPRPATDDVAPPPAADRFQRDDIAAYDDTVRELIGEGRNHELVAMAETVRDEARAAGDALLLAWGGYWASHGYLRLEDYRAGATVGEDAFAIASDLGHTMLAAKSAMLVGENYSRVRDPTALLWQRHAVAQVERGDLAPRHAAYVLDGVGSILDAFGQDSLDVLARAIELRTEAEGPDSPALVPQLHNYVRNLVRHDRLAEAEPVARRMVDLAGRVLPPDALEQSMAQQDLGEALCETGRAAEGLPYAERAVQILDAGYRDVHPAGLAFALDVRATCLGHLLRYEDAVASASEALQLRAQSPVMRHDLMMRSQVSIARWHAAAGDRTRAAERYRAALAIVDPEAPASPLRAEAQAELAAL